MATNARPATEEDLLRAPEDGYKYELIDGRIRMSAAGTRHPVPPDLAVEVLNDVRRVGEQDELDGEDVVPGFRCRLSDILVS